MMIKKSIVKIEENYNVLSLSTWINILLPQTKRCYPVGRGDVFPGFVSKVLSDDC